MKIIIAGDFCPQNRVAELFEKGDYAAVLGEVKPVVEQADYSIVNFECPVTKGGERPIAKCGPNLQCSEKGMEAVRWAGFNCVTLANNHFLDFGEDGVVNTLDVCSKYEIDNVGGGKNLSEAAKILYKEVAGERLAIINCCEHEFSIATETEAGSNPLNPIQQFYAIQKAKKNADYVLVIVHGGNEHYQLPSPRMIETYRFFIDAGADAVINHHQHCNSGYEVYRGKPIFYGVGNFCFDRPEKTNTIWNEGFMALILFSQNGVSFETIPYLQCSGNYVIKMIPNVQRNAFDKKIQELSQSISNGNILKEYRKYISAASDLQFLFSPYNNRWLKALCYKHLLPSFMTKKKKILLLAYLQCESHYPKIIKYLKR